MAYLQKGYLCVWNGNGQVREGGSVHYPLHRLIYEQAHGIVLPSDWVVHHKNGDTLDNRIENLEALSRVEHPSRHRRSSRPGEKRCGNCGEWKPESDFPIRKDGKRSAYCPPCKRSRFQEWVRNNPEKIADYNRRRTAKYRAEHPTARTRLTPEQVRTIRADPRTGRDIAADYRISRWTVYDIKSRRKWASLPD